MSSRPSSRVGREPGWWRTAATVAVDLLGAAAIVLSVPIVILAIGTPIALAVRALLWIVGTR